MIYVFSCFLKNGLFSILLSLFSFPSLAILHFDEFWLITNCIVVSFFGFVSWPIRAIIRTVLSFICISRISFHSSIVFIIKSQHFSLNPFLTSKIVLFMLDVSFTNVPFPFILSSNVLSPNFNS